MNKKRQTLIWLDSYRSRNSAPLSMMKKTTLRVVRDGSALDVLGDVFMLSQKIMILIGWKRGMINGRAGLYVAAFCGWNLAIFLVITRIWL